MNHSPVFTDTEEARAHYQQLLARYQDIAHQQNKQTRALLDALTGIQKRMARSLSRASRHAGHHIGALQPYISSFALTFRLLERAIQVVEADISSNSEPTIPTPGTNSPSDWQNLFDDLQDMVEDAGRKSAKQAREYVGLILDYLDALDRLLDTEKTEPALQHLLSQFERVRAYALVRLHDWGLERTSLSVGNALDPSLCEVVDTEPRETAETVILHLLHAGYRLNGKLLRKAAVIVSVHS